MIVDANLLLYAVDRGAPHHEAAAAWWTEVLNGDRRVGIPWQSIGAFCRIVTHPRVTTSPLTGARAWGHVESWLAAAPTWVPPASERTAKILGRLVADHHVSGNLVPDAMLAALAIEHGVAVMTADTDFARFPSVEHRNPLVR